MNADAEMLRISSCSTWGGGDGRGVHDSMICEVDKTIFKRMLKILQVTVEYVTNLTMKQRRINRDHIKTAMHADAVS